MTPIAERSLRGKLVTIGPLLAEDAASIFLWRNDVAAAKLDLAYRPVDWLSYNNWLNDLSRDSTRVIFAIRKLEEPPIIGFAALTGVHPVHRSAEMCLRIGQELHRGNGYGKDAAKLLLDFAWKSLNLIRIQLEVFANNERAMRAYRCVGFKHEGTRRHAAFIDGEWTDVAIMGALSPGVETERSLHTQLDQPENITWAVQASSATRYLRT